MTDQRRIFIREHAYQHAGYLEQIEFQFIDDVESERAIKRNYNLWLTRDHYSKTILRRYGSNVNQMPEFEEYVSAIRALIAGHCCPKHELRRAFNIYDQNRNGLIELGEIYRLISIIGRSTSEEKISDFIERVNTADDRSLNFEQFKQFIRLGHGREMLVNVSLVE